MRVQVRVKLIPEATPPTGACPAVSVSTKHSFIGLNLSILFCCSLSRVFIFPVQSGVQRATVHEKYKHRIKGLNWQFVFHFSNQVVLDSYRHRRAHARTDYLCEKY